MKILLVFLFFGNWLYALDPVIILLGPPGAGKGSFSQYFKENFGYTHVSIGDVLRQEIDMQTALGIEIKEIINKGEYVDPKIVQTLLAKYVLKNQEDGTPLILDGFGQNQEDAEFIKNLFGNAVSSRTLVLYLESGDDICLERITGRSLCSSCGHVYNTLTARPLVVNRCDVCGNLLKTRVGDSPDVVLKRLRHHRDCVENYYKNLMSIFPSIVYETKSSFDECSLFYDQLAQDLKNYEFDSCDFVKKFMEGL